jgi:hypothetical protein
MELSSIATVTGNELGLQNNDELGVNCAIGARMYTASSTVMVSLHPLKSAIKVTSKYPVSDSNWCVGFSSMEVPFPKSQK